MTDLTQDKARDYTALDGPQLLTAMGDDASKWAAAFCQIAKKRGYEIDEGWMISWFANAIEHSTDVRRAALAAAGVGEMQQRLDEAERERDEALTPPGDGNAATETKAYGR